MNWFSRLAWFLCGVFTGCVVTICGYAMIVINPSDDEIEKEFRAYMAHRKDKR